MLAITPLTPSMYHLPAAAVAAAIDMARAAHAVVFVDDAHMMSRSVFYDEPVAFGLGEIDVAVWSLDKHVPGPRGAAIVGRRDLMQAIMAQAFQFGLKPSLAIMWLCCVAWKPFDPEPIRAERWPALFQRLSAKFDTRLYQGGPGVSFSADDFEVVYERTGTSRPCWCQRRLPLQAAFCCCSTMAPSPSRLRAILALPRRSA